MNIRGSRSDNFRGWIMTFLHFSENQPRVHWNIQRIARRSLPSYFFDNYLYTVLLTLSMVKLTLLNRRYYTVAPRT